MPRQQDKSVILYSGEPHLIPVQEGGSAGAYQAGDLVYFDGNGQIILGTSSKIAGVATEDYTGSAGGIGDEQGMYAIDYSALYLMTAAAAVAPTQAEAGNDVNIDFTAGGQFAETTSSTPEIIIVGLYPGDYTGSAYTAGGRYIVRLLAAFLMD